jgi:diguanylate cyclase (GGDEF)-like protein
MLDSSIVLAAAGVSICTAALSTAAWLRGRMRLDESRREREELEKSSSLLAVETQVMDRMNRGASLTEVMDILTHAIEDMAPECLCSVLLLDEKRQQLWECSRGGLPEEYIRAVNGIVIGPEVGACGSASFLNQTVVVEDIATDPRFATVKDFVMSFGLLACWSVPIRGSNHEVLGTFAMYHRHPAKPRNRELAIVEAGAHLAANAIERVRAAERMKKNEERIVVAERAASLGIWELDFTSETLTLSQESAAQIGLPDAAQQLTVSQLRAMIHADDWQTLCTALVEASGESKLFHAEFRILQNNGLIRWLRTQARVEFMDNHEKRMIGVSVEITKEKEILEDLHFQAAHDGLTGVWNRRAIVDLMHREFEMAARIGTTTGIMMLDLDHFKNVNDTYGHLAGDAVLQESVRRLQQAVRSYDLVGRYGGEEFLVVLPRCDQDQMRACAERVRIVIEEEPMIVDGVPIKLTASVGSTVVDPSQISEQEALAAADAALYLAKTTGRNRTVLQEPFKSGAGLAATADVQASLPEIVATRHSGS